MTTLAEIDEIIIRYADTLSATDISFKLGGALNPAQVAQRRQVLLDVPDALSAAQQDQLVVLKMRQIVVRLEEMPLTSRSAEIILNGLEKIGNRLDKRAEMTESDLQKLYAFQGAAMLDAIELVMAYMKERLDVDGEEWDRHLEGGIRMAQLQLNRLEEGAEPQPSLAELAAITP